MPAKVIDYYIHSTDIGRFKDCRRRWDWESHLRRNLEPRDKYAPLWIGTLVHHGLEMWYRANPGKQVGSVALSIESGTPTVRVEADSYYPEFSIADYTKQHLTQAQLDDPRNTESETLAINLVDNYIRWQRTDRTWLADRNFEFIAPEQEFKVLLWQTTRARVWLVGRFDGIVRRRDNGLLYLWEIKTTRSIAEREKQLDFDEQTSAYLYAARALGYDVQGEIYTLIRKKIPESPRILKNGMLSTDVSIDTTQEHYWTCVKAHHNYANLPIEERAIIFKHYTPILDHLGQQPNKFFKRVPANRSTREIEHSASEIVAVAREMLSKTTPIYMTATARCNYCLFRTPCAAYNRGQDYEAILERDYQQNPKFTKDQ